MKSQANILSPGYLKGQNHGMMTDSDGKSNRKVCTEGGREVALKECECASVYVTDQVS